MTQQMFCYLEKACAKFEINYTQNLSEINNLQTSQLQFKSPMGACRPGFYTSNKFTVFMINRKRRKVHIISFHYIVNSFPTYYHISKVHYD